MTTFAAQGLNGKTVDVDVLLDGGPLCVGPAIDWKAGRRRLDLYLIWFKRLGLCFGPFYARLELADKAMRRVLKAFPSGFWGESAEWYRRQKGFIDWIDRELGKAGDLVGGEWES